MSTKRAAIEPPSDVNLPDIRTNVGEDRTQGSPARGTREDGSGSNVVPDRKAQR